MIADIWTVAWREWKHITSQSRDWRRIASGVILALILLFVLDEVISFRSVLESAPRTSLLWIMIWLPLGNAVTQAIDSFAGERERHTLETLLSTRLPEFAILFGKIIAIVAYAWLTVIGLALAALVGVNIVSFADEGFFLYPAIVLLLGPPASLLTAGLGAAVGALVSLRAPTIRHANTRLFMTMTLLPFVLFGMGIVVAILVAIPATVVFGASDGLPFTLPAISERVAVVAGGLVAAAIAVLVIALLVIIARIRFDRPRMVIVGEPESIRDRLFGKRSTRANGTNGSESDAVPAEEEASLEATSLATISYQPARVDVPGSNASSFQNLLQDTSVMVWKEWHELRMLYREWRTGFWFTFGFLGLMVFQMSWTFSGFWLDSPSASIIWWLAAAAVLPLLIAPRIAESIAGERERHTGEMLFASRLDGLAILLGKVIIAAVPAWVLAMGIPAIGLVVVNLDSSREGLVLYPAGVFLAGITVSLLSALLIAGVGLLVSMEAETTQQAAKRLAWFIIPYLLIPGLGLRELFQTGGGPAGGGPNRAIGELPDFILDGDLIRLIYLVLPVLLAVVVLLVIAAAHRFQRGRLVFD